MDDHPASMRETIEKKLREKSTHVLKVYDTTFSVFAELKELLHETAVEFNESLDELARRVRVEYRDRGKFEAQLQIAEDILIFSMHTNIFQFNREHIVWQNSYLRDHPENSLCGMINIFNFLSDSFKYNRSSDEGYLIGRIFVNHEMQYFTEGKREITQNHNSFGSAMLNRDALNSIIENSINYAIDFDLLVPPYDAVKVVTVDQLNTKIENSKMQTGKRLGYRFDADTAESEITD